MSDTACKGKACKNVTKKSSNAANEERERRKFTTVIFLVVIGVIMIFAPFFFYIVLNWVIPIFGFIIIIVAFLIAINVINIDNLAGAIGRRKK